MYQEYKIYTDTDKHIGFLYCDSSGEARSVFRFKGDYNYFNHHREELVIERSGVDVPPDVVLDRPLVIYYPAWIPNNLNWEVSDEFKNFDSFIGARLKMYGTFDRVSISRWVFDRPWSGFHREAVHENSRATHKPDYDTTF